MDADAVGRHAGRARDRQGPLPGPGGRVRRRRRPLRRARRARADRRRVRAAAGRASTRAARSTPTRRSSATTRRGRPRTTSSTGRRGTRRRPTRVFDDADVVVVTQEIPFQRVHPAPLETCGAVADYDAVTGKLRLWCTTQAPHAHRTLYAIVAGLPEHKIQVIAPDIGGGFGNKVPIYPGYVCAVVASIVSGHPVKWMEDRTENLTSTGFARDYLMRGQDRRRPRRADPRAAGRRARRPRRVQRDRAADEVPGRVLPHLHRLLRPRGRVLHGQGRLHEQGAGRRRVPLLVPRDRGGVPRRADGRPARRRAGDGPGRAAAEELHPLGPVPLHDEDRLGRTTPATTTRRCARRCGSPATRSCAASRPRSARGASTWASASRSSPRRSAPARGRRWTSPASAWPTAPSCACTRPARPCCASRSRPRARATRRRSRRSSPRSWGSRPRTSRSCTATPTRRRSGSAPTAAARRRCPAAATAMVARKVRDKRARQVAAAALEVSPDDLEWEKGRWFVEGRPGEGPDDPGARARVARRAASCPRASRATSTRSPSTTRRT